jgi:hypothetical protein
MPLLLGEFIESVAAAMPCPVDFPGVMILPVLATLIGRKRCIEIKLGWREYAVLWAAVVARSGERKTPTFLEITAPLRQRQRIFHAQYLDAKAAWKALPPEEREENPKPCLPQIFTTDTTIEALKTVLANNPSGIVYAADELSGWARSIGQYKGGRGDDRQAWLSFWSSTDVLVNRKGDPEPLYLCKPFVSVTGGIQPDALPDVIDDAREDGFAARLLFSWPDAIPETNWSEATIKHTADYYGLCEQLWDMEPSDEPVTFSAPAKERWVMWVNSHRAESVLDNLRPTWAKAEGHCLRLTLVLHLARLLCNETRSRQIDVASIEGAIKLTDYFKGHAHKVYGQLAVTTGNDRIAKALRWIRKHGGHVTARLARVNGFTRDSNEAVELFHDLEELGHGTVAEGKQGNVSFTLRTNTTI